MALEITPERSSVSKLGDHIYLIDGTGAYNVTTNPGGYGAPNYATGVVQKVVFNCIQPNIPGYGDDIVFDAGTTPTAAQIVTGASTVDFTTVTLGNSSTIDMMAAGVYQFKMTVYVTPNVATTVTLVNGDATVTAASGLWTDAINSGLNNLDFDTAETVTRYGVLNPPTSNTVIELTENYAGANAAGVDFLIGFSGIVYIQNFVKVAKCLNQKFADYFGKCGSCDSAYYQALNRMNNLYFSAIFSFDLEDYSGAQDKINIIQNFCDRNKDCNC